MKEKQEAKQVTDREREGKKKDVEVWGQIYIAL